MKKQSRQTKRMSMAVAMIVMAAMIGVSVGGRRVQGAAPMTFTVTSLNDSGAGSLRQAILDANANAGPDTITFELGVTGTITLMTGQLVITDDLKITGPGATSLTVSGNDAFRVFTIDSVTVTISGLTISNGKPEGSQQGGGILNIGTLTISNCTVSDNSSDFGGGIRSDGTLTIISSTVSGNTASNVGAGGGGIVNGVNALTIINSTVSGNTAAGAGGGVHNSGTLTIINSTVSDNSAGAGGGGGIITVKTATILNSTLSGNSASGPGGAILIATDSATVNIKNSIVANITSGGNCDNSIGGTINAFGTNFSTDDTCTGFTNPDTNSDQLKLLPLALNAPGTTATHALELGSVAIDAVTDCTDLSDPPSLVTTDQRGVARPIDGNGDGIAQCDVGAYELVRYNFEGFFQPVDNLAVNGAKAGASIPVKFSLSGDQGLDIFAGGYPKSGPIACDSGAPSEIEETETAGNSGLSYDATLDQYKYLWKTEKAWKGTCRQLILKLSDGSVHTANFRFR